MCVYVCMNRCECGGMSVGVHVCFVFVMCECVYMHVYHVWTGKSMCILLCVYCARIAQHSLLHLLAACLSSPSCTLQHWPQGCKEKAIRPPICTLPVFRGAGGQVGVRDTSPLPQCRGLP